MSQIRYPELHVQLTGTDGNAFAILGKVAGVLRRSAPKSDVDAFLAEATAGDYGHLLVTCTRWVNVS